MNDLNIKKYKSEFTQLKEYYNFRNRFHQTLSHIKANKNLLGNKCYLIDKNWLEQWKKYVGYNEICSLHLRRDIEDDDYGFVEPYLEKYTKKSQLPPFNTDIIFQNGEVNPLSEFSIIDEECFEKFISGKCKDIKEDKSFPMIFIRNKLIINVTKDSFIIIFEENKTESIFELLFVTEEKDKNYIIKEMKTKDMKDWLKKINFDVNIIGEIELFQYGCTFKIINKNFKKKYKNKNETNNKEQKSYDKYYKKIDFFNYFNEKNDGQLKEEEKNIYDNLKKGNEIKDINIINNQSNYFIKENIKVNNQLNNNIPNNVVGGRDINNQSDYNISNDDEKKNAQLNNAISYNKKNFNNKEIENDYENDKKFEKSNDYINNDNDKTNINNNKTNINKEKNYKPNNFGFNNYNNINQNLINNQINNNFQQAFNYNLNNHKRIKSNNIINQNKNNLFNKNYKNVDLAVNTKEKIKNNKLKQISYPHHTGLANCGDKVNDTSYLNSAIQCLSNIKEFTDSLLEKQDIFDNIKIPLTACYSNILNDLFFSKEKSLFLIELKDKIEQLGFKSNCPFELIEFLIKKLNEELTYNFPNSKTNLEKQKEKYKDLNKIEKESRDEKKAKLNFFNDLMEKNYQTMINVFYGMYHREIKCNSCNLIKYSFEELKTLKCRLKDISNFKKKELGIYAKGNINLYDYFLYLNESSKKEITIDCLNCGKIEEGSSKRVIYGLPMILIIKLDFENYNGSLDIADELDFTQDNNIYNKESYLKYYLYSIISSKNNNYGNPHYKSFCRNDQKSNYFICYDDEIVKYKKNGPLKNIYFKKDLEMPYILIYHNYN